MTSILRSPRALAWGYAALVLSLLAYFMLDIPVQLTDSFQNIVAVQRRPLDELVINQFSSAGYLRPLLHVPISLVYSASGGDYTAWFRGAHVVQLAATLALFVALLRVHTWPQLAVVPLALAACVSLHTFAGTIREAFPVNTFLTVILCCLAAALIASSRWRWWSDAAAVVLLVFCALTVESGLLVWVILAAGYIAGWRGVSKWGVALATLVVAAYFGVRFFVFDVGTPSMMERSSGFGLAVLDPEELVARFGSSPWPFYAYNVAASAMSVLFAEPRNGVFWVVREFLLLDIEPWTIVNVVACSGATAVLVRHVVVHRDRWLRWRLEESDRLVFVFFAVLGANAVMNYSYTKDVVMSPAGAFFALAVFAATVPLIEDIQRLPPRRALVASLCIAVFVSAWGVKAMGVHYSLRDVSWHVRNEWAEVDRWLIDQEIVVKAPQELALKEALEADALWRRPARPRLAIHWPWPGTWFDASQ